MGEITLRTRAIADATTKTDSIDMATLAKVLGANHLPKVSQPDPTQVGTLDADFPRIRYPVPALI